MAMKIAERHRDRQSVERDQRGQQQEVRDHEEDGDGREGWKDEQVPVTAS